MLWIKNCPNMLEIYSHIHLERENMLRKVPVIQDTALHTDPLNIFVRFLWILWKVVCRCHSPNLSSKHPQTNTVLKNCNDQITAFEATERMFQNLNGFYHAKKCFSLLFSICTCNRIRDKIYIHWYRVTSQSFNILSNTNNF